MKKSLAILFLPCLFIACTVNKNIYYVISDATGNAEEIIQNLMTSKHIKGVKPSDKRLAAKLTYDKDAPNILKPELIQPASNYDPTDMSTFPVYAHPHTVEKPPIGADYPDMAIWCTKEATYLAVVYEQMWQRHYFHEPSEACLRDSKTGKRYPVTGHWGLPLDQTYFLHGLPNQYVCLVTEYPPLDPDCTVIDILEGEGCTDVVKGGLEWGGIINETNIPVATLQANQPYMKFKEVKVIR